MTYIVIVYKSLDELITLLILFSVINTSDDISSHDCGIQGKHTENIALKLTLIPAYRYIDYGDSRVLSIRLTLSAKI